MNKITLEMPMVHQCSASACTYNSSGACHAKAVTIGDAVRPDCDTFFRSGSHARDGGILAGVGACKVGGCRYNQDFECTADTIRVGVAGSHVQCLTFEKKVA